GVAASTGHRPQKSATPRSVTQARTPSIPRRQRGPPILIASRAGSPLAGPPGGRELFRIWRGFWRIGQEPSSSPSPRLPAWMVSPLRWRPCWSTGSGWHRRGGTASRRAWPEVTGPGSPPGIQGDLTDRPQVVPRVGKMAQHPGEGHVVVQPGVVGGEHLPDGFVGPPQARLDLVPPRLVHRADSPALG